MVAPFDVPGRMAQGRAAVDTVSQYVWASHQVGYQHPDLTVHAAQLRDWYGTEDGMNLSALQQDCAALDAAVRAADEAVAVQERALSALSDAWQGAGARASQDFLHRHGVASADVAHAVRTAAEALRRVGEQVWSAVDTKVDAVVAVEKDVGAARAEWLAASATVISGVGDRVAASELVETAVKPFVDSRIRTDWLSAVQAASAAIADAYQGGAAEIRAASHAAFAIPGDLGPAAPPPPRHEVADVASAPASAAPAPAPVAAAAPAAPVAPMPTMPSAWEPPPAPAAPMAAPPPAPAPPPPAPPMTPPLSDLGSGLPGAGALGGGALPAVGQRFADALSGLLGGGTGAADLEPTGLDPAELDPPDLAEEESDDAEDEEPETGEEPDEEPEPDVEEGTTENPPLGPAGPVAEAVPAPTQPPPPPPPPPPAEPLPPLDDERTPCAIAADEVPQVGGPAE